MNAIHQAVKLRPIRVPNFILSERDITFPVAELSAEVLEALCVQFRTDLYKRAGKDLPK